jgi:hypothetical protein
MGIANFTAALQSQVYKNWLSNLDKNIVTATSKALRDREQVSQKTSFYITTSTVKQLYKTIANIDIDNSEAQIFLSDLLKVTATSKDTISGTQINVNGETAVFFKNIGFDTISTKITNILDAIPEIQDAYYEAEQVYYKNEIEALKNNPKYKSSTTAEKRKLEREIADKAKERGTLGYYFNKGHVISVATNLVRQFRNQLAKVDFETKAQRDALLEVLDSYIDKLVQDDLATANLPNAVDQELYAGYIKSSNTYLVELQHRVGNIQSGRASIPIIDELRNIFNLSNQEFATIINKSPALGITLINTPGSPSFIDLIAKDIADTIAGKTLSKKVYKQQPVLVAKKSNKISKPKSNKQKIQTLTNLKNKLKAAKPDTKKIKENLILEDLVSQRSLTDLQNILASQLTARIRQNMGTGSRTDILNYRTGRFAESARVERITQGREGMITAYYNYMRYPYATFSQGGRQEFPRSRDPKLLISKSIREIMQEQMITKMRAVLA